MTLHMNDRRKLAVVTGASSGIGLELALQFANNGFDLILSAEDDALGDVYKRQTRARASCGMGGSRLH